MKRSMLLEARGAVAKNIAFLCLVLTGGKQEGRVEKTINLMYTLKIYRQLWKKESLAILQKSFGSLTIPTTDLDSAHREQLKSALKTDCFHLQGGCFHMASAMFYF